MRVIGAILGLTAVSYTLGISYTYAEVIGTSSTGLDRIIQVINNDEGLKNRIDIKKNPVTQEDVDIGAKSADEMNKIILEAIKATGVANDGIINTADARDLNDYIYKNHYALWKTFHGDDDKATGIETGYHRVQNDGGNTVLYGENAINTVFDGIYHLGFETSKSNNLLNEDGNNNATFTTVGFWVSDLLKNELSNGSLRGPNEKNIIGTTHTGLDKIIDIIKNDPGVALKVSTSNIREASSSANEMNRIIIDSIKATGVANDNEINTADARELNDYIFKNYHDSWVRLHGDDKQEISPNTGKKITVETGYHLVQNDGGVTQIFGKNAINTVFDGIYHLGFSSSKNNLKNEDGNGNAKFSSIGFYLQYLLQDDLRNGSLRNGAIQELKGTTNTGLDQIIEYLKTDVGLNQNVKTSDMLAGAHAADGMNAILIEAFKKTGVTNDGNISEADIREINLFITRNYLQQWSALHGDDDKVGGETGFHLVQNDGASKKMFGKNAVNTVFDGIYHLGFVTTGNRLKNEDGNNNASFKDVAAWLDGIMGADIRGNTTIRNSTFTGLDIISGSWYMLNNGFKGGNFLSSGIALLKEIPTGNSSTINATLNFTSDGRYQNGFVIFDYISPTEFKYVGARAKSKYWTVGQYKDGKYKDLKKFKEVISPNKDYIANISLAGNTITLNVDSVEKIQYTFANNFNQQIGLAVEKSSVEFKNITIINN
ncbi:MAG: hypothetical protein PHQ95_00225 [Candidatus Gracilibacteria bacterium]|nr:hypothetical protein [Candidatus Gracilibacteria bacterium]